MVYFYPPTLDAIISFALAKESAMQDGTIAYYNRPHELPFHQKGLSKLYGVIQHKGGSAGVAVASWFQPEQEINYIDSWKKRFEREYVGMADFGQGRRRINTASGHYRSYNMPLDAHVVASGYFAFIGDGSEVLRLIDEYIPGIGKKVSEGFGWIDQIKLIESDLEWRDILKLRPVPIHLARNHGIDGNRRICAWKAPYWRRGNICECVAP